MKGNFKAATCRLCGWRPTPRKRRDRYDPATTDWRYDTARIIDLIGRRPDLALTTTPGARYAAAVTENA